MNNFIQKAIAAAMTIGLLAAVASQKASAAGTDIYGGGGGCVPVYGGGVQCPRPGEILVDKTIRNPSTGVYVDNLGPNDPMYRSEWIASFHITVRNPREQSLDYVTVSDALPNYVDFSSGPAGSVYDNTNRKLTWTVSNLAGGTEQTFEVKVRIVPSAALPSTQNVICPTNDNPQPINIVDVTSSNGKSDHDEARFCIEKTLVVPDVPKAGPSEWVLTLLGLGASLKAGLILRNKKI